MVIRTYFTNIYETMGGESRFFNRPQFIKDIFAAGGSPRRFESSPHKTSSQNDIGFRIFNGTSPLSSNRNRSFPSGVDTNGLASFYAEHIRAQEAYCEKLMAKFDIRSEACNPECLAMALSLQFEAFVDAIKDDPKNKDIKNVMPKEYARLWEGVQNCVSAIPEDLNIAVSYASSMTNDKSPFAQYIDSERQLFTTSLRFDYRAETIPFCFRERELEQLDMFCEDERIFLWWAITGNGGMGKSRLAHQYMKTRNSDEWKIIFLRSEFFYQVNSGGKYQQFNDWTYPSNLMLIVDYAQRYSAAVAEWCESISAKKISGKKIRVLLIDRFGEDGLWYKNLSERSLLISTQYRLFLTLTPLKDEELKLFAQEYAKTKGADITEGAVTTAIMELSSIDNEKRILYFVFLLDQMINEDFIDFRITKLRLLNYVLDREIKTIEDCFSKNKKAFKCYMQLLITATIIDGLSVDDASEWTLGKIAVIYDAFLDKTSAQKAMAIQDGVIKAITPDILGEHFVLTKYYEYFILRDDEKFFMDNLWGDHHINQRGVIMDFMLRAFTDFTIDYHSETSKWFAKIVAHPINSGSEIFNLDYSKAAYFMSWFNEQPRIVSGKLLLLLILLSAAHRKNDQIQFIYHTMILKPDVFGMARLRIFHPLSKIKEVMELPCDDEMREIFHYALDLVYGGHLNLLMLPEEAL